MLDEGHIIGVLGIVISIGLGVGLFFLGKLDSDRNKHLLEGLSNALANIGNDESNLKIEKTSETDYSTVSSSAPTNVSEETQRKIEKCKEILEEPKWKWRTDIILMKKSGLSEKEFDDFVKSNSDIVESRIPDINGNRLFGLRKRVRSKFRK
ncbi:hypothetical protein [Nitrosopumilus sp.]|uniref:hypothetical protein n=1 Tax=Nitrosopumilus sp. TaxID=2024843 RepID=UPI003B5A233A